MKESPLTEQSPAGRYYVVTGSFSVYEILLDPDRQPQIIRYRAGANVSFHDGEPLTGVGAFRFDAVTGEGIIGWWKGPGEDRDDADAPYAGSYRRTSGVRLILHDATESVSIAPSASPSQWPEEAIRQIRVEGAGSLLDRIRLGLSVTDDGSLDAFVESFIGGQD